MLQLGVTCSTDIWARDAPFGAVRCLNQGTSGTPVNSFTPGGFMPPKCARRRLITGPYGIYATHQTEIYFIVGISTSCRELNVRTLVRARLVKLESMFCSVWTQTLLLREDHHRTKLSPVHKPAPHCLNGFCSAPLHFSVLVVNVLLKIFPSHPTKLVQPTG